MSSGDAIVLLIVLPALVVPLIVGLVILIFLRGHKLASLAGLFTLKPVVATPIWLLIFATATPEQLNYPPWGLANTGLLPAIGLTLIIVLAFRRLYWPGTGAAYLLLAVDVLRWANTFLVVTNMDLMGIHVLVGLFLPTAYAVMALVIAARSPEPAPAQLTPAPPSLPSNPAPSA